MTKQQNADTEELQLLKKKLSQAQEDIDNAKDNIQGTLDKFKRQYTDKIKKLKPEWSNQEVKKQVKIDWEEFSTYFDMYIENKTIYQSGRETDVVKKQQNYELYMSILDMEFPMNKAAQLDTDIETIWVREDDVAQLQADIDSRKTKQKEVKKAKVTTTEQSDSIVPVVGHIYPVNGVKALIKKLKEYNARMDAFIERIENLDPVKIDVTWICQKCEAFCRRINYMLALLRYEIIKGLNGMYQDAKKYVEIIAPIAEFNPTDILGCLGWVKDVIKFFLKPYMYIITFIQDFFTYTPQLISESTQLVAKAAAVPALLTTKLQLVATSSLDGTKKDVVDAFSESIKLKMEPITLGDITGGPGAKPTYNSSNNAAQQKQMDTTQKQIDNIDQSNTNVWDTMVQQIIDKYDEIALDNNHVQHNELWNTYVLWPEKANSIGDPAKCHYYYYGKKGLTPGTNRYWMKEIFGAHGYSKPEEYYGKKFNNSAYPIYPVFTPETLELKLSDSKDDFKDTMYNYVVGYYKYQGSSKKSERNVAQEYVVYVEFLKSFNSLFPCIDTTLKQIQTDAQKQKDLKQKLKEQGKVSVFK